MFWLQLNSFLYVLYRNIILLFFSFDASAVRVGSRILRIEFDATIVIGDSPVEVALFILDVGAVVVGDGILRIESNSVIVVGDSPS